MNRAFVWLGGALFMLSLAFCAYSYLIVWGRPADVDVRAIPIDAALFGVFAAHHSVLARERAKAAVAQLVSDRLARPTYVWIASLLLIAVCAAWRPVGGEVYRATGWGGGK